MSMLGEYGTGHVWPLHLNRAMPSFSFMKFYFDTLIWRDYYENRSDNFRPLGEWALELINKSVKDNDMILYSDAVVKELKIDYDSDEIKEILEAAQKILFKVEISKNQLKEAKEICIQRNVSFGDALHAILARDNDSVLVSRDKHFLKLLDIVDVKKPEELI